MDTKRCSKCGEVKVLEAFYRNSKGLGNRASDCKGCCARYRAENADKVKAKDARYYAKNADKVKARQARYRAENADKLKAGQARYRAENAGKVKARQARYQAENADKAKAREARYRDGAARYYVAALIGLPVLQVPPEVIELKRQAIALNRAARTAAKQLKGTEK